MASPILKCAKCDYTTLSAANMKKHSERMFPCDMKLNCELCGKKFKTRTNILKHNKSCTRKTNGDKIIKEHPCDTCNDLVAEKNVEIENYDTLITSYINRIVELETKLKLVESVSTANQTRLAELKERLTATAKNVEVSNNNNTGEIITSAGIINGDVNVTKVVINMPKLSDLTTNLSYMTEDKFREILAAEFQFLKRFIETIFFTPAHRENHTLFIDKQHSQDDSEKISSAS